MRVLILSTHFRTGGITSYVLSLAKGLHQKGVEVFVATSGGNMVETLEKLGIKHLTLNINTKSEVSPKLYFALRELKRFIRENNIDVVHTQTRVTQVLGALLSKMMPIKHVSTCHGFFKPRLFRKIFPCWGSVTIAISKQVCDHLVKDFKLPKENVFLVSHGIELQKAMVTDQEKKEKRRQWHVEEKIVLGTVARLSDVKGLDILIQAMRSVVDSLANVSLVIAGEGREESALKKLTAEFSLEGHIKFLPIVNSLDEVLPCLDIFVMPSRQEGLGLSVMEAQAQGLAVVASSVGGLQTLIENGKTGILVEKENPEALAQALIDLIRNPQEIQTLGQNAQKYAQENFSLDEMIERTIKVYRKALP